MQRIQVEQAPPGVDGGPGPVPNGSAGASLGGALDLNRIYPEIGGSITSVRGEIDDAAHDMTSFYNREPDEIMRLCSGYSARLSEIRIHIQRIEDFHRQWKNVRTRELEPCLDQLRHQFEVASRRHTARMDDWRLETGAR